MSSSLRTSAKGVLFCHAIPRAVVPHAVWAIRDALGVAPGTAFDLDWTPQPVAPGSMRATLSFTGRPGTAARLVSALRVMPDAYFEVTEEAGVDREGERYSYTPMLGLYRATIGVHGDIFVHEERLRALLAVARDSNVDIAAGIAHLIGQDWDAELEPYRTATCDTPVRVLHHVV